MKTGQIQLFQIFWNMILMIQLFNQRSPFLRFKGL